MAQKTGKEETEFKVPEALAPCVNNCGFTGNPATNNMCQNCFNAAASNSLLNPPPPPKAGGPRSSSTRPSRPAHRSHPATPDPVPIGPDRDGAAPAEPTPSRREVSRCSGCRKRVGLTGFRCRCGDLFCAEHRYSDRHDCSYDYKSAGREAIARENPLVKAAKILRV